MEAQGTGRTETAESTAKEKNLGQELCTEAGCVEDSELVDLPKELRALNLMTFEYHDELETELVKKEDFRISPSCLMRKEKPDCA